MAFTYIATEVVHSANATSLVINKPTGTVDDDIMFVAINRGTGGAVTPPSGWTLLGTQTNYHLYYKKASSEPSSYTWGLSAARTSIVMSTYRGGFDLSNPIDVVSNTTYTTSNTTVRAASMNVTYNNSPIIYFGIVFDNASSRTFTAPTALSGFTEDYDGGDISSDAWTEVASIVWSGSGSTGSIDATVSGASTTTKHAFAVALKPDTASSTSNFFMLF